MRRAATNRVAATGWRGGIAGRALHTVIAPVLLLVGLGLAPLVLVAVATRWLFGRWLRSRWEATRAARGKRILLVYSHSPNWHAYIETSWLPRLRPHAVVLDWSSRGAWPRRPPLEVRAFRHWGGREEFNPLAVLFPQSGPVRAIRFHRPFLDDKRGRPARLRAAEAELFAFVAELERTRRRDEPPAQDPSG